MDGSDSQDTARRRVTLAKGDHRWSFFCEEGDEAQLLGVVQSLAQERRCAFDWLDAAVVSHQFARRLTSGLHKFSKPSPQI